MSRDLFFIEDKLNKTAVIAICYALRHHWAIPRDMANIIIENIRKVTDDNLGFLLNELSEHQRLTHFGGKIIWGGTEVEYNAWMWFWEILKKEKKKRLQQNEGR